MDRRGFLSWLPSAFAFLLPKGNPVLTPVVPTIEIDAPKKQEEFITLYNPLKIKREVIDQLPGRRIALQGATRLDPAVQIYKIKEE